MAEQKKENCLKCGADIRPGALFCYSCGSAVEAVTGDNVNGGAKNSVVEETVVQEKFTTNPLKIPEAIEKPAGVPLETPSVQSVEKGKKNREKKLVVQKETKLKTAAALRRKPKSSERNPVEIVWEAPENSSHTWFVLAALILVLFAVVMLMGMLYLR